MAIVKGVLKTKEGDSLYPQTSADKVEGLTTLLNGKNSSYVATLTSNPQLNSQEASILLTSSIVDVAGRSVTLEDLNVGDSIYVTDTGVPDRWVAAKTLVELPTGYTPVSYLQGDGTAYIDLGMPITDADAVEIVFEANYSTSAQVFGSRTGASANNISLACTSSSNTYLIDWNNSTYSTYRLTTTLSNGTIYRAYLGKSYRAITTTDGSAVVESHVTCSDTINTPANAYLFFASGYPPSNNKYTGKIYEIIIGNAAHLVPCIDPNNEVGMYDLIRERFYGNAAGSGAFVAGAVGGGVTLQAAESLTPPEIYWCTYGTTSYASITQALTENKLPACFYDSREYVYVGLSSTGRYTFASQLFDTYRYISVSNTDSWGSGVNNFEVTSNKVTALSSSSTNAQYPSAKVVYDNIQDLRETIDGKRATFVVSDVVLPEFNSQSASIHLIAATFTDINNNIHNLADLKVGDAFYVTESGVPDRWVGGVVLHSNVDSLSGTEWQFNSSVTSVVGNWTTVNLNFQSNNNSFTSMVGYTSGGKVYLQYKKSGTTIEVYNQVDGWLDESYRTINISGGNDSTTSSVISWLQANATIQSDIYDATLYILETAKVPVTGVTVDGTSVVDQYGVAQIVSPPIDAAPTDGSANAVSSNGVYDALQDIRETIDGKRQTYVCSCADNPVLDSQSSSVIATGSLVDISHTTIALAALHVGDTVYVTDTEVPDRWVSGFMDRVAITTAEGSSSQPSTPSPSNPVNVQSSVYYNVSYDPVELRGIGTNKDTYSDGTITRLIGVYTFTGTEAFDNSAGSQLANHRVLRNTSLFSANYIPIVSSAAPFYCTHFTVNYGSQYTVANQLTRWMSGATPTAQGMFCISEADLGITSSATQAQAVAAFQGWLAAQYQAGTPVRVYYPVQTPTTESVVLYSIGERTGASLDILETAKVPVTDVQVKTTPSGSYTSVVTNDVANIDLSPYVDRTTPQTITTTKTFGDSTTQGKVVVNYGSLDLDGTASSISNTTSRIRFTNGSTVYHYIVANTSGVLFSASSNNYGFYSYGFTPTASNSLSLGRAGTYGSGRWANIYLNGSICKYNGNNTTEYTITIPNKTGTMALLSDMPIMDTTPTDGNTTHVVSSDGIYDAIQEVRELAEGRKQTYVCSDVTNVVLNSQNDSVSLESNLIDINSQTVALSALNVGDTIYVSETDVPDRWVSNITQVGTVTDLAGTNWYLKSSLSFTDISESKTFNVGGVFGSVASPDIRITTGGTVAIHNPDYLAVYSSAQWADASYRTVSITSGTDSTNTELINWFLTNAVLVVTLSKLETSKVAVTDIQVNGTTILNNTIANLQTQTAYNSSTNKLATMSDIPSIGALDTTATTAQATAANEPFSGNITLHKVSKTGSYTDLLNQPSIPTKTSDLTDDVNFVHVRPINAIYNNNAAWNVYLPSSFAATHFVRITMPDTTLNKWTMLYFEVSIMQKYNAGACGKLYFFAMHNASGGDWSYLKGTIAGNLSTGITLYGSDHKYLYVSGISGYGSLSIDKIMCGDSVTNTDISGITIDTVTSLPATYQTGTIYGAGASLAWGSSGLQLKDSRDDVLTTISNATVASAINSSLSYSDLQNKPTIPDAPGTLDTTVANALSPSASESLSGSVSLHKVSKTGSYTDLLNKPTIPTALSDLSSDSTHQVVTQTEKDAWNGKQNALTFDATPTESSLNPVTSGGVYDAIEDVREVAEGKTATYVCSSTTNTVLNSQDATVNVTSALTDIDNRSIGLAQFVKGDNVYIPETSVPDRWVSSITWSGAQKGDRISLNLDGTSRMYRVLRPVSGSVYEIMGLFYPTTTTAFAASGQTYEGSDVDTYLNTTWYNTLTSEAKAAIVDTIITQDSWYYGTSGSPVYTGHYGAAMPYQLSLGSSTFGSAITRKVYALSVQDAVNYLGVTTSMTTMNTTLTSMNLMMGGPSALGLFFMGPGASMAYSKIWMRSANAGDATKVMALTMDNTAGSNTRIDAVSATSQIAVCPVFQIDLSGYGYERAVTSVTLSILETAKVPVTDVKLSNATIVTDGVATLWPRYISTTSTTSLTPSAQEVTLSSLLPSAPPLIQLHKISKTGSYNDLLDKPTIPTVRTAMAATDDPLGGNTIIDYIASRGQQLMSNGTALLGTNYNFSAFAFDGSDANFSGGCFTKGGATVTVGTDEFMPVIKGKTYKLTYDLKTNYDFSNINGFLPYLDQYDIDGYKIQDYNCNYIAGTLQQLTQDLVNGDTHIYVADISSFAALSGNGKRLQVWNYINSRGYAWAPGTYTRNTFTVSGTVNVANNCLDLSTAYSGSTIPAGTYISQNRGGGYAYIGSYDKPPANVWTSYTHTTTSATIRYGCAYACIGWLWNYNVANTQATTWDSAQAYDAGKAVVSGTTYYISKQAVPAGTALTNSDYWYDGQTSVGAGVVSKITNVLFGLS